MKMCSTCKGKSIERQLWPCSECKGWGVIPESDGELQQLLEADFLKLNQKVEEHAEVQ